MRLTERESRSLEFRREVPAAHQITKTLIAFANGYGGRLMVGVADDGSVVGVTEHLAFELLDSIPRTAFDAVTPTLTPRTYTRRMGNALVVIAEVSSGMNKPYFRTSEGPERGVYIRVGSSTRRAGPDMVARLHLEGRGVSYDETPAYGFGSQDIDEETFQRFLAQRQLPAGARVVGTEKLLEHYRIVVDEHGRKLPTIGGILLFGKDPQQRLTEAFAICSAFHGTSGTDAFATTDARGTVFEQLEAAMEFVSIRLARSQQRIGLKRSEQLDVPPSAFREVLVNAVAHRDYSIPGPIKIALYADRVEVFSPGPFPGPIDPDDLESGFTYVRNRVLAQVLRQAGYMEKLGSGFRIIYQAYREQRLPAPTVLEGHDYVKCILPRGDDGRPTRAGDPDQTLLALFEPGVGLPARDLEGRLNISRASLNRVLRRLVAEGKLQRLGRGPATRYVKL